MIARFSLNPFIGVLALAATLAPAQAQAQVDDWLPMVQLLAPEEMPTDMELEQAKRDAAGFDAACELGDMVACKQLGDAYYYGRGAARVVRIAAILYRQACDADIAEACTLLGKIYESQYSGEEASIEDLQAMHGRAPPLYAKGCGLGDPEACFEHAQRLYNDAADQAGRDAAEALAQGSCDKKVLAACLLVAEFMLDESGKLDRSAEAEQLIVQTCRNGSDMACYRALARIEESDPDRDSKITEVDAVLCSRGNPTNCGDLAISAILGRGMEPDRELGLSYFDKACLSQNFYCTQAQAIRAEPALRKACEAGDRAACTDLGRAVRDKPWELSDQQEAYALLVAGCGAGDLDACFQAGSIAQWESDFSSPLVPDEVMQLFEKACGGGVGAACFWLAKEFESGHRVQPDEKRAALLFSELCIKGGDEACRRSARYAGLYDEVPMPTADGRYVPPFDPSDIEKLSREERILARLGIGCELHSAVFRGMEVFAYGWGWTANEGSSTTDYLQGVKMQLRSQEDCAAVTQFEGEDRDSALCAAGAQGEQTCYGDSGGGLVYYGDEDKRPKVVGVVSGGRKCGTTGKPSQYTRIAKVREWIDAKIAEFDGK